MGIIKKVFIIAGEASGDLHGGMLVNAIKELNSSIRFYGVGGSRLERAGVKLLYDLAFFSSMGFIEPILKLRFYRNALKDIQDFVLTNEIDAVILIDFPGFNLLLAKKLKKHKIKIIYYISPQIWAWHYSRIKKIKRYVDSMVVIYPFEEEIYKREGVRAFFVGNPLIDIVQKRLTEADDIECGSVNLCIGLLPGSRLSEIKRHLGAMLDAAGLLQRKYSSLFLLPVLEERQGQYVKEVLNNSSYNNLNIQVIYNNTYKAIEKSDFLIISSGTATLEAAIIGKPMVIIYKIDIISELVARLVLRVKNISLVNIVAGKRICPELLQRDVNGKRIFNEVSRYLDDKTLLKDMISEIRNVRLKLGSKGTINRIAKIVLSLVYE